MLEMTHTDANICIHAQTYRTPHGNTHHFRRAYTHSLTHTHTYTHTLTHTRTDSRTDSLTHSLTHSLTFSSLDASSSLIKRFAVSINQCFHFLLSYSVCNTVLTALRMSGTSCHRCQSGGWTDGQMDGWMNQWMHRVSRSPSSMPAAISIHVPQHIPA